MCCSNKYPGQLRALVQKQINGNKSVFYSQKFIFDPRKYLHSITKHIGTCR